MSMSRARVRVVTVAFLVTTPFVSQPLASAAARVVSTRPPP